MLLDFGKQVKWHFSMEGCLITMPEDMQSKNSRKHINLMKKKRNASTMNKLCRLNSTFTPLVMSATGGMGQESSKFYSLLSELISEKRESSYSIVATWIRRKIIFALIKSIGMCLRGSRSVFHREKLEQSIKDDELLSELSSKV